MTQSRASSWLDAGGLAHAVAEDFAAAEFAFVAIDGEVAFDLEPQRRVAEADFVAGGRAVDFGVVRTFDFVGHEEVLWIGIEERNFHKFRYDDGLLAKFWSATRFMAAF